MAAVAAAAAAVEETDHNGVYQLGRTRLPRLVFNRNRLAFASEPQQHSQEVDDKVGQEDSCGDHKHVHLCSAIA